MKVPVLYADAGTNIVHINKGNINTAAGSTLNKTNHVSIWFPQGPIPLVLIRQSTQTFKPVCNPVD